MAINFPGSLDDNTSLYAVTDNVTDVMAVHHNNLKDAVIAVETKLGTGADTSTDGDYLKGNGAGTSEWADFDTDVSANSDVSTSIAHVTSDGSDHTFIDQSVVSGASPTFDGNNFTGVDADDVDIADAGSYFIGTEVETSLQEVGRQTAAANSPMIITGGEITVGTNAGTFKVAALTALFRSTDSVTAPLIYATLAEQDNQTITAADTTYTISLNYNGGSPTITLVTSNPYGPDAKDYRSIPIGKVMKDGSDNVHFISGGYNFQDGVEKLHIRAKTLRELELDGGSTIAYSGTNNFTMTEGIVYGGLNKFITAVYDSAVTQFIPIYRASPSGWTEGAASNVIDYAHYDDGDGTLGNVGVSKYGCHWVYRHVDDGDVYVRYGEGSYSLAEAEAADEPTKPDHLTDFGILVGKIVAPQAGGSFTTIQMVSDTFFSGTSVSDHGSLGGLADDDHPQYIKDSEFTQNSGVLVGTGAGTFAEETGDTLRTSLGLAIGTDVLAEQTIGIANDNLVEIDSADVADDEYARFTAAGLESRSVTELRSDINVEDGADVTDTTNVTAAGALMDSEVDADIKTLVLPANTTISAFGASLVDDADAGTARATLDVDQAGTDNSTNVTLDGTPNYITIVGQVITRAQIDLTTDVTGNLPTANVADLSGTNTGDEAAASTTVAGVVELATTAETTTGTDTTRAVTPDGLKDGYQGSTNVTTLGTIATGVWEATDVAIAHGGTGASTAQSAIDALTAVSGATNEHVLTKDTATGNAVFKAAAGVVTTVVGFSQAVENATFDNTVTLLCEARVVLTKTSSVMVHAFYDARFTTAGKTHRCYIKRDGATKTTGPYQATDNNTISQRSHNSTSFAESGLAAGTYDYELWAENATDTSSMTVGDVGVSVMAIG